MFFSGERNTFPENHHCGKENIQQCADGKHTEERQQAGIQKILVVPDSINDGQRTGKHSEKDFRPV